MEILLRGYFIVTLPYGASIVVLNTSDAKVTSTTEMIITVVFERVIMSSDLFTYLDITCGYTTGAPSSTSQVSSLFSLQGSSTDSWQGQHEEKVLLFQKMYTEIQRHNTVSIHSFVHLTLNSLLSAWLSCGSWIHTVQATLSKVRNLVETQVNSEGRVKDVRIRGNRDM